MNNPRISDNDAGEITATVGGKEVRGWSYRDDAEHQIKMRMAHEFAEGWFQAGAWQSNHILDKLLSALPVVGKLNVDKPNDPINKIGIC